VTDDDFVTGGGEISNGEAVLGESGLEQRLKIARMLHAIRQRIANDGNMVTRLELKSGRLLRRQSGGPKEKNGGNEIAMVHRSVDSFTESPGWCEACICHWFQK